jgi:hypothetical protein
VAGESQGDKNAQRAYLCTTTADGASGDVALKMLASGLTAASPATGEHET